MNVSLWKEIKGFIGEVPGKQNNIKSGKAVWSFTCQQVIPL